MCNKDAKILSSGCATSNQISVRVKCGFDGAGSHAVYNQIILCADTSHLISCIFSAVHVYDMKSEEVFWGQKKINCSAAARPLIIPGKERHDIVAKV